MPKISDIIEEQQFLSSQISVQVRTIALSILALSWGLLVGQAPVHLNLDTRLHAGLVLAGLLAILVLVIDFLQYLFGYRNADALRRTAEAKGLQEIKYDENDPLYLLRKWMFNIKIVTVFVAFVYLLILLLPRVL